MSQEVPDGGLASQPAADATDGGGIPTAFAEIAVAELQPEGNPISQPDQLSDSMKNDQDVKIIESKGNGDNEQRLQVEPKKLDSVVETSSRSNRRTEATPFCPQTGQPHSVLLTFGYDWCPKCNQTGLTKADASKAPINGSGDQKSKADNHLSESDVAPQDANITYAVEYRDSAYGLISKEPWGGPFDLVSARKGVGEKKTSIFDVVTILQTTLRPDPRRIMKSGILNDPKIGVTVEGSKVVIHSPNIIKDFASVTSYYPSFNFATRTLELVEPYSFIAHHLGELEVLAASNGKKPMTTHNNDVESTQMNDTSGNGPKTSKTDLRLLLDFITTIHKDHITNERERYKRQFCTFRMLWLLFKPGDTVYCQTRGRLAAYVVQNIKYGPRGLSDSATEKPYELQLWNLSFDGQYVGRCAYNVIFTPFEGERAIRTLKAFPCQFIDMHDGGELRQKLEQYGKQWYELLTGRQVQYSGKLLDPPNKDCHGRVYIDMKSYFAKETIDSSESEDSDDEEDLVLIPRIGKIADMGEGLALCPCEECLGCRAHPPSGFRWSKYDVIDPWKTKNLETSDGLEPPRHRYLLCPRELYGLVLKSRTWAMLDVANCSMPQTNTEAIQSLVMPQERKTMIEALVQRFSNHSAASEVARPWRADHMEGKGEGQIFLLHGGPGVGKTFTAGKALLSLTSGDLGTDEKSVEKALNKWFTLAEAWGAVMLIDEADVYLERRQITDLKRNSLVSVFLRSIEYYRGILFLTTNRVGIFDDAFTSRIHVVIAYDDLGNTERKTIWKQFFDKLTKDRHDITITKRAKTYVLEDDDMVNIGWNGREIRNAFQTAVALADYRAQKEGNANEPTLDQKDFEQVLNLSADFKQYLKRIDGVDENTRAFRAKNRALAAHDSSKES